MANPLYAPALRVICPFCGAAPGRSCIQVSILKRRGIRRSISPPHVGRTRAAAKEKAEAPNENHERCWFCGAHVDECVCAGSGA